MQESVSIASFEFEVATLDYRGRVRCRDRSKSKFFQEAISSSLQLEMVEIPSGRFEMGSPQTEVDRTPDEGPQQSITLSAFFISKYPVTQSQWKSVASLPEVTRSLNAELSQFKGANRPVENVSWHEAIEFCARLSRRSRREYRLPSEAEWEYACRARTVSPFHFGETITTDYANYWGEHQTIEGKLHQSSYQSAPVGASHGSTTEVGKFQLANAFGLYDMHGNVWEWCSGEGSDTYLNDSPEHYLIVDSLENGDKPLRGGAWNSPSRVCRSACRFFESAHSRFAWAGFRVVCASMRHHQTPPLVLSPDRESEMVMPQAVVDKLVIDKLEAIQARLQKVPNVTNYNITNHGDFRIVNNSGDYYENNAALEQDFEVLLADYVQFIQQLQQKYPSAADETAIAKVIDVEYQEVKRLQPQRWQNFLSFKRLLNGGKKAIVKGGEHFTEHNIWGKMGVALLEGMMENPK